MEQGKPRHEMFFVYPSRRWRCINYVMGHADSLASWVLWARTAEPHPGQTTAWPHLSQGSCSWRTAPEPTRGHPNPVLVNGHAQPLSGGIWDILTHGLFFLKSTLHLGNMKRKVWCVLLGRLHKPPFSSRTLQSGLERTVGL